MVYRTLPFWITQNGTTKMPEFGELLGQDAAWAIRTYIETRPDDVSMEEVADELKALRDQIVGCASDASTADADALKTRLSGPRPISRPCPVRPLPTAQPIAPQI